MEKEMMYDFDRLIPRDGTHSDKYELRQRYFGKADVDPFWVADMDLPAPAFLAEALQARTQHALFGYTVQYGGVFDAIGWWMNDQHGVEQLAAESILLSPSVVTSISLAIQTFTGPGDAVALLSPVYGPFYSCTTGNDRTVADCPLQVVDGRFEIDFDAFARLAARDEVKLLLLCNPQNPGGRVWSKPELERLAGICAENNVVVFSDEIHSDIVYPPHRQNSMLSVEAARGNCIVAHSIGKTFNCSGIQASFVMIPDGGLRTRFRQAQDRVHAGDVNLFGKVALQAALSPAGAEYKRQLVAYLRRNTLQVCEKLRQLDGVTVMEPEATFLVWCDFRQYGAWQEVFKRLVHEVGVALSGGTFFGPAGEGWFRINCAHPQLQLLPAVDRIVAGFRAD